MASKNYFSREQIDIAKNTNLVDLLQRNGEQLKRSGSEYEWKDGTQKVTIRNNVFFHQYERVGGSAIEFCEKFYGMNFAQAVSYLLGQQGQSPTPSEYSSIKNTSYYSPPPKYESGNFILPPKNADMKRAYAYLLSGRKLDKNVVNTFIKAGMIYESAVHHNVVFVGYDKDGNARHASKRGTATKSTYKGNVEHSVPEYSFHWNGTSNRLFLFEAPIDMLSFISMHQKNWEKQSFAACCSVSDKVLFQCLQDNPSITEVYLCLDNDEAGQAAEKRMTEKLKAMEREINVNYLIPTYKDWNEDLQALVGGGEAQAVKSPVPVSNEQKQENERRLARAIDGIKRYAANIMLYYDDTVKAAFDSGDKQEFDKAVYKSLTEAVFSLGKGDETIEMTETKDFEVLFEKMSTNHDFSQSLCSDISVMLYERYITPGGIEKLEIEEEPQGIIQTM